MALAITSTAILLAACADDVESQGQPNAAGPAEVATGLDVPWGVAFLPDGTALIAERNSGAIKHLTSPGVVNDVGGVAGVAARGEGGSSAWRRRAKPCSPTSLPGRTTGSCR